MIGIRYFISKFKNVNICIKYLSYIVFLSIFFYINQVFNSYASGWKQDTIGWRYENRDGSFVTNEYRNSGKHRMYLDENGYVATLYYLQLDNGTSYFYDKDGYLQKYGCVIIGTSTKSNEPIDNDYILYFNMKGEVIIKLVLTSDNMPSHYIESRQEYFNMVNK